VTRGVRKDFLCRLDSTNVFTLKRGAFFVRRLGFPSYATS